MALAMTLTSALAFTSAGAAGTVNANFDYNVTTTNLAGPTGGAGETWNQDMVGGHPSALYYEDDLLDSDGNATTIDWSVVDSGGGSLFRWATPAPILTMLDGGIFSNQATMVLTISDLDLAKTYDLYITGYGDTFGNNTNSTTSNTTTTVGTQNMTQDGDLAGWVLGNNYILFEDVAPDVSGDIVINMTKVSGYGFVSGFQLVETVPEPSTTALLGLGGLALILRRRK
jgi:hypothetical protein